MNASKVISDPNLRVESWRSRTAVQEQMNLAGWAVGRVVETDIDKENRARVKARDRARAEVGVARRQM